MTDSINIVCPHCNGVNRLPQQRLGDGPVCGRCKGRLFEAAVVELDQNNFDQFISRNEIPVVVDFWAPWCGPCKAMAPAFAQAAKELEPLFRLAKLNTEAEQNIAMRMKISSIPTVVLFYHGRELQRQSGAMTAAGISNWVKSVMSSGS